ncbi:MAG: UDP-glucose dehydrogenase family protein [Phycisphaerae bacterium]
MRICMIGSGYVGLVTGACLADSGNHVVAVDSNAEKIRTLSAGHCPFYEPGLSDLLEANLKAGRLRFTTDLADGVRGSEVIFIAVGTPSMPNGSADTRAIQSLATDIGRLLSGPSVIVIKSTVPVGTGRLVEKLIAAATQHAFHVVSNPEFLKEGNAIDDFLRPDRVVIGSDDRAAGELVAELYKPFVRNNKPILIMSRAASELTKYAANGYLATRISFINEIAALCEAVGVDVDEVRRGIGTDARIGQHFLYPGAGYGGSCFPKDVLALEYMSKQAAVPCDLLTAVNRRNQLQREALLAKVTRRFGELLSGRTFVVWGLAFKPKTDDVREAPALWLIDALLRCGASVAVHDPRAMDSARAILGDRVRYCGDAYEALAGSDALITVTEWMEYRSPDFPRIRGALKQPVIIDGRNIYDPATMRRYGFEYYSIGRPDAGEQR